MSFTDQFQFDEELDFSDILEADSDLLYCGEEFVCDEIMSEIPFNKVKKEDFDILKVIGRGGFGKVFMVTFRFSKEIFAMKVLRKDFLIEMNAAINTRAERDILRNVSHPFIVKLHYAFQDESRLYLVMDFVNGGQLFFHLREHTFSEDLARFYTAELVLALEHLHNMDIIHRDLKPENILLDSEGHVVLTDFGFAKANIRDGSATQSFCGSIEYMAPEMVKGISYGKGVDWWSVGILLYDMITGSPPFQSKSRGELQQLILRQRIRFPPHVSPEAESLINGLCTRDPCHRLGSGPNGIQEIKAHNFFREIDWEQILMKEVPPPFRPRVPKGRMDTSNFDEEYLNETPKDSPAPISVLSLSQEQYFKNFSFVRSPVPFNPFTDHFLYN